MVYFVLLYWLVVIARLGCEKHVALLLRQNANNVIPSSLAKSTANEDGADMAARNGILALKHLMTISYETRPLTVIHDAACSFSDRIRSPITLSIALCLPISSIEQSISP